MKNFIFNKRSQLLLYCSDNKSDSAYNKYFKENCLTSHRKAHYIHETTSNIYSVIVIKKFWIKIFKITMFYCAEQFILEHKIQLLLLMFKL